MDKLKLIKENLKNGDRFKMNIGRFDVEWLIDQAEKVEQLEKEIENLKQYKKVLMENSVVRSETIEKYEKALRFYANKENYELWDEAEKANLTEFVNNLDMDKGETARKALGE
jgi:hypothetical protein